MIVLSACNHKGGTGKTTSVLHIAAALGLSGYRVLVIDLDPQSFLTRTLGVEEPSEAASSLMLFQHYKYRRYMRKRYTDRVLDTVIRTCASLATAHTDGTTVFEHDPYSRGARDYANATDELLRYLPAGPEGAPEPVAGTHASELQIEPIRP